MQKKVVYPELESCLAKKGILKKDIAELLGITQKGLSNKLNGKYCFTLDEAIAVREKWFSDIPIEVLFAKKKSCISGLTVEIGSNADKQQPE